MEIDRIVLCCMDFRCNEYLNNKYNDGKTLFFRNAGAHVKGIEDALEAAITQNAKTLKEITILVHGSKDKDVKGCAAMGAVYGAVTKGVEVEGQFTKNVIWNFDGLHFNSAHEVEKFNRQVQEDAIKALVDKMGLKSKFTIKVEYLETGEIYKDTGTAHEKVMHVVGQGAEKYDSSSYYVQGCPCDVAVAESLGIRNSSKKLKVA